MARPRTAALLIIFTCLIASCGKDTTSTQDYNFDAMTVYMPGNTFSPASMTINVGQAVTFDFPATAHNVIFQKKGGQPADIQATSNQQVARTFNTAGTFPYDCTLHPGMSGQIVVR